MKEEVNARAQYEQARVFLEAKVRENPQDGPRHALFGLIYAGLGGCDEALSEAKRATELLPEDRDAFDGPILSVSRARILVKCGDTEAALQVLEHSIQIPAGITVAELQLDPSWDPLRKAPRFQQLIETRSSRSK